MSLKNKNVVIFGGSSGIGLATARRAASEGARVTITGRDPGKLRDAAAAIGSGVRTTAGDVASPTDVGRVFEGLDGRVDHVFVTTGSLKQATILDVEIDMLRREIEERVFGAINVVRAAHPLMSDGSITLTSGIFASRPQPGTIVTSIAIDAMEVLARSLPLEIAPIRVNAVAFGIIDTPTARKTLGSKWDAVVGKASATLPVKRIGTEAEAAEAVVFLMSNGFINGEVLHIDGGGRMREVGLPRLG